MPTDFSFLNAGPVTASLVVDNAGKSISAEGNSRGIGNRTDLELLRWLRRRSQVVLTSGITAEAEDYAYPENTELAILTNTNRSYPRLVPKLDRVRFLSNLDFADALKALLSQGFSKIHTEFGETGFQALAVEQVQCFLSSQSQSGIHSFVQRTKLIAIDLVTLPDLHIARVVGRGRD